MEKKMNISQLKMMIQEAKSELEEANSAILEYIMVPAGYREEEVLKKKAEEADKRYSKLHDKLWELKEKLRREVC